MRKFIEWFRQMLDADNSMSSKRFCGIIGWIAIVVVLCYCTYKMIQAPDMIDIFTLSVVGLLGVDSVTNIWKNKDKG